MKKINYFDLGLHLGQELDWFVNGIFPELKIDNYTAHGFEACEEYCSECENKYNNHPKVNIHHLAISNKNEPVKLYYSEHPMGHSVFDSKKNIRQSKEFEEVQGIKFSGWLRSNVPDFEQDINMIKINIEGAEWHLINDMVENDMVKDFDIFFGCVDDKEGPLYDVFGIGELSNKAESFRKTIKENKIKVHRLSEGYLFDHPNLNLRNCNLKEVVSKCLEKY